MMQTTEERQRNPWLAKVHLDGPLLLGLIALAIISLFVIYSARWARQWSGPAPSNSNGRVVFSSC